MFSLILFLIGFIMSNGTLGANIINGLNIMLYLYYIGFGLVTIIYLILIVSVLLDMSYVSKVSINHRIVGKFSGVFAGLGMVSLITLIYLISSCYFLCIIYVSNWIVSQISLTANSFSELSSNSIFGLVILTILILFSRLTLTRNSK